MARNTIGAGGKQAKESPMTKLKRLRLGAFLVPALFVVALTGACGGDGGGGTGSDEQFVADLCKAGAKFDEDLTKLFAGIANIGSEEEAAKKFAEPFEAFARSFKAARPPADLKAWHAEASKSLDDAVKALKGGNTDAAIFAQDSPFPEPPAAADERLSKIAEKNADCQKANLFSQ
jgi:hypothetical protein